MTLFEIDGAIMNCVDSETGEIIIERKHLLQRQHQ